jgi:hypothetical protein
MPEQTTVVLEGTTARRGRRLDRRFYIGVALGMILFSILAFAPAIIDQSTRNTPLPLPCPSCCTH